VIPVYASRKSQLATDEAKIYTRACRPRKSGSPEPDNLARSGRLFFIISVLAAAVYAELPPELPGEELTQQHFDSAVRRGGAAQTAPEHTSGADVRQPSSASWLEAAMVTWYAPTLDAQMAADDIIIPFGKGGVFVPRYTETNSEPDFEVYDLENNHVGAARTGTTIALVPGNYDVTLGSGSQQQRIVKRVTVTEGRTTPVVPDWSGLIVEVVDEQGVSLRGEYELVRIDEFDPYGRGYGASVELGETVKAWILKPGTYKILGAGEGYNTMTNFVTVRLLPGELTNFLLIQEPEKFGIRGGGTLQLASATRSVTSNWHWGANIGANMLFNAEFDHEANLEMNSLTMGLLFDTWVFYRKKPVEWNTRLRLDESINIADNDPETMINTPDRMLLSSIFIWRILNWFGPYARSELNTKFFETKVKRGKEDGFCFVDADYIFDVQRGLDTAEIFVTEPALSPVVFEIGAGVNADLTTRRYFEAKTRLGFGCNYSRYADRYRVIEADKVEYPADAPPQERALAENRLANSVILYPEQKISIFEVGPQASFGVMVRIGIFASAEAEVKLFAPVAPSPRFDRPDFDVSGTLSWRLSSLLNLDYTYRQTLRQPAELDVPDHKSSHGIWLRLHFSSR